VEENYRFQYNTAIQHLRLHADFSLPQPPLVIVTIFSYCGTARVTTTPIMTSTIRSSMRVKLRVFIYGHTVCKRVARSPSHKVTSLVASCSSRRLRCASRYSGDLVTWYPGDLSFSIIPSARPICKEGVLGTGLRLKMGTGPGSILKTSPTHFSDRRICKVYKNVQGMPF